jgi:predicted phosphodiesterase
MASLPSVPIQTRRFELSPEHSRLLVLGDPHGAIKTVKQTFAEDRDNRTLATCVGDVVGYADGPDSSRLAEFFLSEGIPTVEGNHEDWARDDGSLAIVQDQNAARQLSTSTLEWMRSLPAHIEFRRPDREDLLALMVHSIRHPNWDWIKPFTAPRFLKRLGEPRLVLSGHSHRPKFMLMSPSYEVSVVPFNFESDEEITIVLPDDGCLIVDSGSLGRAELEPCLKTPGVRREPTRFGTYSVIDFESRKAVLRRIERTDEL